MASTSSDDSPVDALTHLEDLKALLWGNNLKEEVFLRWTQGFSFSEDEPTALIQHEGGPCAVIVPVQAFLLKNAIFPNSLQSVNAQWRQAEGSEAKTYLLNALEDILVQTGSVKYNVVFMETEEDNDNLNESDRSCDTSHDRSHDQGQRSPKRLRFCHERFHSKLRCAECNSIEDLQQCLNDKLALYQSEFGVLMYLYSVLLTKGIDQTKNEMEDPNEPLIDSIHGHGSQSLINLLLTGRATSHVFDGEQDVSGLKLHGISRQSRIGFLTQLEHLRYCEVGFNLKNPLYPVWVLGSETHLTVLFTEDTTVVTPETKEAEAKRIFKSYDPEGNGFISSILLGDVLGALDLVAEPEYVEIMKTKLDEENLGIIVLSSFMEEFFPEDLDSKQVRFPVYHYNGLKRSNPRNKVSYQRGEAIMVELGDSVQILTEVTPLKTCLKTKWPSVELEWDGDVMPSLN